MEHLFSEPALYNLNVVHYAFVKFLIFALVLGIILGIIHFYSEKLKLPDGANRYRVISFAAGISIAYLFLNLLPHTYEAAAHLKNFVFVFLLLGFVLFHLAEKFIYKHADQKKLARELKEVHSISFFFYYFIIGIVLYDKVLTSQLEGIFERASGQKFFCLYPQFWA